MSPDQAKRAVCPECGKWFCRDHPYTCDEDPPIASTRSLPKLRHV